MHLVIVNLITFASLYLIKILCFWRLWIVEVDEDGMFDSPILGNNQNSDVRYKHGLQFYLPLMTNQTLLYQKIIGKF